jgi:CTP:phosphocholine cytidylyltransferase-like protein
MFKFKKQKTEIKVDDLSIKRQAELIVTLRTTLAKETVKFEAIIKEKYPEHDFDSLYWDYIIEQNLLRLKGKK